MKKAIWIIIVLVLLVGCTSSYEDCKMDCIGFCMEGKEYKEIGMNEPLNLWDRATSECRHECYDDCKCGSVIPI